MSEETYTMSFRVWHPTESSKSVMDAIGLIARFSQSVGEPRANPNGQSLEGTYKETYCSFMLAKKKSGYFLEGVNEAIPLLSEKRDYLKKIRDGGGRMDLFIGVFIDASLGFVLTTAEMYSLSELGIDLSVEFHV